MVGVALRSSRNFKQILAANLGRHPEVSELIARTVGAYWFAAGEPPCRRAIAARRVID
jgi:hypothetical protein